MARLDMNPDSLRRLADAQEEAADRARKWARQPTDWLNSFPANYGSIATPVLRAMKRYYNARERAGNDMADQHERAAQGLRAAADAYEREDADGARDTSQIGFGPVVADHPVVGPSPLGPLSPGVPVVESPPPAGGPASRDGAPSTPVGPDLSVPPVSGPAGTVGPPLPAPAGDGFLPPGPAAVPPAGAPVAPQSGPYVPGGGPSGPGGGPSGPGIGPAGSSGGQSGPSGASSAPTPPLGGGRPAPGTVSPPPDRFPAAVAAARERAVDSARVSGKPVNDDLVVARTFLAAVLAATESTAVGVSWAAAVLRGSYGAGLFVTTNEGRGWLPAGLFLPREVSTPWLWDEVLGDGTGSQPAVWEGIADPARVLVEFGQVWGPKAGAALTALVSSGPIDPRLRAQLGAAATEGMVRPSNDVDLRVPTVGTVDRLGLTRPTEAMEHDAVVPDTAASHTRLRERCLELAAGTHMRLGRTGPVPSEAAQMASLRDRIIAMLQAGQEVPRHWWDELRAADELLAASLRTRRVDVARGLGHLRVDDGADALRALVFQRRCTELVLLLDGKTSWQQLRDIVYAHEQVVKHPVFVDVPAAVVVPESARYRRPVDMHRITAESNERVVSPTMAHPIPRSTVSPVVPPVGPLQNSEYSSDSNGRG